jgi:dTDP-glucose pyrophosphorylase
MLVETVFIPEKSTIVEALKSLDKAKTKALLVVASGKILKGTISDGDIRRFILRGGKLEAMLDGVYNKKPIYLRQHEFTLPIAKEIMIKNEIGLLPVIDNNDMVTDSIIWEQIFSTEDRPNSVSNPIDVPVIIMAGGKGTRMAPFTQVLPKPLVPIGDRTIVEIIIEEFEKFGIKRFYLTLNYRGEMIEAYFKSIEKKMDITFLWEKNFLGTAGSLKLLEGRENIETFIVSNCDIIVKADYSEVVHFHKQNNASLTVISSIQHHTIPYGVVEFQNGGEIKSITEKPELNFSINTGVYILDKECLLYLSKDSHMDMTTLITTLMENGKKVFTYPVKEGDYIDIGEWDEYRKAVEKMRMF